MASSKYEDGGELALPEKNEHVELDEDEEDADEDTTDVNAGR